MKKILKYSLLTLLTTLFIRTTAFAAEYTVTDAPAVLYTNANTIVCSDADLNTVIAPSCEVGLPVKVTGITSNGFFRVDIGQVAYIPGNGLVADKNAATTTNTTANTEKTNDATSFVTDEDWYKDFMDFNDWCFKMDPTNSNALKQTPEFDAIKKAYCMHYGTYTKATYNDISAWYECCAIMDMTKVDLQKLHKSLYYSTGCGKYGFTYTL